MRKRFFSLLLSLCMVLSLFPTIPVFAETATGGTTKNMSASDLTIEGVTRQKHIISSIKVAGNSHTTSGIGIIAIYTSEGELMQLETTASKEVITEGTYPLTNSIEYNPDDVCKVFVWDGLDTMKPLTEEAYIVPKYEYSIETVCKVSDFENMTVANTGYIYYEADNVVYQCETETGDVQEFFNPEDMEYTDGTAVRRDFNIDLIFFNNYSGKLYMCGHYTTKDYASNYMNCAVYEITNQEENLIYFNTTNVTSNNSIYYFRSVSPIDENNAYIYSTNGIKNYPTVSYAILDLNSGEYEVPGQAFGSDIVYKYDDEYYKCDKYGLYYVGSRSANKSTIKAKPSDNVVLWGNDLNNTQGFNVYDGKMYYAGQTAGDIYYADIDGSITKYIFEQDVYQHGDNKVSTNTSTGDLDYFSLEYKGLPIWYDKSLKTIKRYVKN